MTLCATGRPLPPSSERTRREQRVKVAGFTTSTGGRWRRCNTRVLTLHVSVLSRRAGCGRLGSYRSSSQPGDVGPRAKCGTKRPHRVRSPSPRVTRSFAFPATIADVLIADYGSPETHNSVRRPQRPFRHHNNRVLNITA